jgi:hypothetical protein
MQIFHVKFSYQFIDFLVLFHPHHNVFSGFSFTPGDSLDPDMSVSFNFTLFFPCVASDLLEVDAAKGDPRKMKKSCHDVKEDFHFPFFLFPPFYFHLLSHPIFCILGRHKNNVGEMKCAENGTYFMHC